MKNLITLILLLTISTTFRASAQSTDDRNALLKTTEAIRNGFGRGDVAAVVALHHPDVMKWFGGDNVVNGRTELEKGLTEMFRTNRLEFIESKVESIIFNGETAIETSLFTIKVTPKAGGGTPSLASGRAMVVYIRYKDSPTGWASIREMTQAAESKK